MTNADSSLCLPTNLQEEMVVVGQSLQPAISNALNLSRISYNEEGNDPSTMKKQFEHNLSQEALYEAKHIQNQYNIALSSGNDDSHNTSGLIASQEWGEISVP